MKKNICIMLICLIFFNHLVANDDKKSYIESSKIFSLMDDRNFSLKYNSNFCSNNMVFYIYDEINENELKVIFYTHENLLGDIYYFYGYNISPNFNQDQRKYLFDTESTAIIADFNYDNRDEFLEFGYGDTGSKIGIYKFFSNKDLIDGYHVTAMKNALFVNKNSLEITEELYLNGLKFSIINNRRGIIIKQYKWKNDVYTPLFFFYYWSPSEQRFILDESVTQEQLKNAHCPDDYFAYNGLKFSKLDSKLTAEDLQDLDKAQLRLMRNAVYARHGRTFKSVDLQSLWNCYTWYKVNPNYSDELLTDIDKYNIKLIQQYEAQR